MDPSISVGQQLRLERVPGAGGAVVKLSGVIDETFDRARFLEGIRGITVLDLDGVTRITSYGVREWMNALRALPQDSYCCFVRCHPTLVSQFNMVNQFGGSGQLVSFYAPYQCPSCDHLFEVLVDLRRQFAEIAAYQVPSEKCPKCGTEAEFDDLAESYFGYVASSPKPAPPPEVNALIDGESSATTMPFRIEKEIAEDVTFLWLTGELDRVGHFKRLADGLEGKVLCMLGGVIGSQDEGVAGLAMFLRVPEIALFLARIKVPLAWALGTLPDGYGNSQILSFQLSFICPQHGMFEQEILSTALRESSKTSPVPVAPCPTCGTVSVARLTPEEAASLQLLPLGKGSSTLLKALADRPRGPLRAQGTDRPGDARPASSFGRYELVRRIGAGGMAEVFLARQHGPMGFEKRVVLKRILPHYSSQPAFVDMFLQEARLAARISHPNVVQIFDLGREGDEYFIAMEYVRGWDLGLLLNVAKERAVRMPVEVACRIVKDICAGLRAAHTCGNDQGQPLGIIHRDVSPHNVLVSVDGNVKVTDFGIAKVSDSKSRTDPGVVKGKINYNAPELFSARMSVDGRIDVWAAGVILFQCLTDAPPFLRPTEAATMQAIIHDRVPLMSSLRPDSPPGLDAILIKALAKARDQRYLTALAFEEDLAQLLATFPNTGARSTIAEWVKTVTEQGSLEGGVIHPTRPPTFTPSNVDGPSEKTKTPTATKPDTF